MTLGSLVVQNNLRCDELVRQSFDLMQQLSLTTDGRETLNQKIRCHCLPNKSWNSIPLDSTHPSTITLQKPTSPTSSRMCSPLIREWSSTRTMDLWDILMMMPSLFCSFENIRNCRAQRRSSTQQQRNCARFTTRIRLFSYYENFENNKSIWYMFIQDILDNVWDHLVWYNKYWNGVDITTFDNSYAAALKVWLYNFVISSNWPLLFPNRPGYNYVICVMWVRTSHSSYKFLIFPILLEQIF